MRVIIYSENPDFDPIVVELTEQRELEIWKAFFGLEWFCPIYLTKPLNKKELKNFTKHIDIDLTKCMDELVHEDDTRILHVQYHIGNNKILNKFVRDKWGVSKGWIIENGKVKPG